jgi:hypothetical protein
VSDFSADFSMRFLTLFTGIINGLINSKVDDKGLVMLQSVCTEGDDARQIGLHRC